MPLTQKLVSPFLKGFRSLTIILQSPDSPASFKPQTKNIIKIINSMMCSETNAKDLNYNHEDTD